MTTEKDAVLSILGISPDIGDLEEPRKAYENYMKADRISKIVKEYKKELRLKMFDIAEKTVDPDEKGSYKVRFEDGAGFKKEARTRVTINEDKAKELAEKKGIDITRPQPKPTRQLTKEEAEELEQKFAGAFDIEEKVDENLLEQAYLNGELSDDEFEELVNKKVNYALRKYKPKL